jgi:hypothetical protein
MAKAIRFYGKLVKSARGPYVVDTQDGRYEFDRKDLVDVKPYNVKMDEILIREHAAVTIKTTVAKLLKGKRAVYGSPPTASNVAPAPIRPGLMYNGSHEWRG